MKGIHIAIIGLVTIAAVCGLFVVFDHTSHGSVSASLVTVGDVNYSTMPHANAFQSTYPYYRGTGGYHIWQGSKMQMGIEWYYETAITGSLTQVELRASDLGDGYSISGQSWTQTDPSYLSLYINGHYCGHPVWRAVSSSGNETYPCLRECLAWDGLSVPLLSSKVVFELFKPYNVGPTGYVKGYCVYTTTTATKDVDGDSKKQMDASYPAQSPNGIFDGNSYKWEFAIGRTSDPSFNSDPIYQFTYDNNIGPSPTPGYNETIVVSPSSGTQYSPFTFDYFFNSTAYKNYIVVRKIGSATEYYNQSTEMRYGNRFWTPDGTIAAGTYYVIGKRNHVVVANTTFTVASKSPYIYCYVDDGPYLTGSSVKIYYRDANHTDFPEYIAIRTIDDNGNPVGDAYQNSHGFVTSTHVAGGNLVWKPGKEGVYYISLMQKHNDTSDAVVSECYLFVRDREYDTSIEQVTKTAQLTVPVTFTYTNNFCGSDSRIWMYSYITGTYPHETGKFSVRWHYKGSIAYNETVQVGAWSANYWYDYGYLLYRLNFTMNPAPVINDTGSKMGIKPLIGDFGDVWNEMAHYFGIKRDVFKIMAGAIIMMLILFIPLIYTAAKSKKTSGVVSIGTGFAYMTNPMIFMGLFGLGMLVCYGLGLFPIWVFLFCVIIFALVIVLKGASIYGGFAKE